MNISASFTRYRLNFRFTAVTSRESMTWKDSYFIRLSSPEATGIGEAGLFRGLSCDDRPDFEEKLADVCININRYATDTSLLADWPAIRMGVECAIADLRNKCPGILFPTPWTEGKRNIIINGLIWMGDLKIMTERVEKKLAEGFRCIKLKIGGLNFDKEIDLIRTLRSIDHNVEIRVDANGAFSPAEASSRLETLALFGIHSIEQPIRAGQWRQMAQLCRTSPIPIALDEELIGINSYQSKMDMLDAIGPQYIILKPTLCGGLTGADEWIKLADERGTGWWATSALESNIGLNAIAQWIATKDVSMPQGLGTGQLYHNNISSPLRQNGENLSFDPDGQLIIPDLTWHTF